MQRRSFLAGMTGLSVTALAHAGTSWRALPKRRDAVQTRNSARNLIMVLLDGGPSHVDTFDLKTGVWTPNFMGVATLGGSLKWPLGLMPKLGNMTDQFALIRSISAIEAVHDRAVYHLLTGHRQSTALLGEIPHFASVVSHELAAQRTARDSMPTFISVGANQAENGFLDISHRALEISADGEVRGLTHDLPEEPSRLNLVDRFIALSENRDDAAGRHVRLQKQARQLMEDDTLISLLGGSGNENDDNNGESTSQRFEKQCQTATRLLAANRGTRVIQLRLGDWDHHDSIYIQGLGSLHDMAGALDNGLALLHAELAAAPGVNGGSLLDETLVVAVGEFGRTVGRPNSVGGRDHYPYVTPALMFGGGVQGGRVIGATSADGGGVIDAGWSRNRLMGIGDLIASLYSALGIDWTKRFLETPSGRVFEPVDSTSGPVHEISELFV